MDISSFRLAVRSARSGAAVVVAAIMVLALAPAFLSSAEGAAHRMHVTTKSTRFVPNIRSVQSTLNQCRGPVVWNSHGEGAPWLMFEHNYCGGSWALHTHAGDRLQIRNGPLAGTWRATGKVRLVNRGAMVSTTRGLGELVVQTCLFSSSKMRLVGFSRVS